MHAKHPAGPIVGDIRWLGPRTLIVGCRACPHQQVTNVEALPDSVPLWLIAAQFVCPICGHSEAYILPNWNHSSRKSPTAEATARAASDSAAGATEPTVSEADSE